MTGSPRSAGGASAELDAGRSRMPGWLPGFNRRVTNRVQGIYAPYVPPLAVVIHVGRNTGCVYTTPVAAQPFRDQVAIPLPYSARAQWVRNLLAAGGGEMIRAGRRVGLARPRVLTSADAEPLPPLIARAARHVPILVADVVPGDARPRA